MSPAGPFTPHDQFLALRELFESEALPEIYRYDEPKPAEHGIWFDKLDRAHYRQLRLIPGGGGAEVEVSRVTVTWERQSVRFAGLVLPDAPADLEPSHLALNPGRNSGYDVSNPVWRRQPVSGELYVYAPPNLRGVFTEATVTVHFVNPMVRTWSDTPAEASNQIGNLTGKALDVNGADLGRVPHVSVLEVGDHELPVVPAPTPRSIYVQPDSAYWPRRQAEIVWPASGAPYLHVFRTNNAGDAEEYHVLLSAGLPV